MSKKINTILLFLLCIVFVSNAQQNFKSLYTEAGKALYEARTNFANLLLPEKFSEAEEFFDNAVEINKESGTSAEAIDNLKKCMEILNEIQTPLSERRKAFDTVLKLRQKAFGLNADLLASTAWETAEENFADAVERFNDGEIENALSMVPKIEINYKDAIAYAQKANELIYKWQPLLQAYNADADVIAPEEFNDGWELYTEALEMIEEEENLAEIQRTLIEAARHFEKAREKAEEFGRKFPDVLQTRRKAQISQAEIYASKNWQKAEELLNEATENFFDNNISEAETYAVKATFKYGYAWNSARKKLLTKDAKLQIKLAKDAGAEKYAPNTLKKSIEDLGIAQNMLIESAANLNKAIDLIIQAKQEAETAREVAEIIAEVQKGDKTWEDEFILHNSLPTVTIPAKSITRTTALYSAMKALARAKEAEAEKYSPKLFAQSKELLDFAKKEIGKKNYSLSEIAKIANKIETTALRSMKIAEIVSKIENGKVSAEEIVLNRILKPAVQSHANIPNIEKKKPKEKTAPQYVPPEEIFTPEEAVFLSRGKTTVIRLVGIKYPPGQIYLNRKGKTILDKLLKYLNHYNIKKMEIRCFTDNIGSKRFNEKLSLKRAAIIKDYLVKHSNILPGKIKIFGMGPALPIASNRTKKGREANKRVEVTIVRD